MNLPYPLPIATSGTVTIPAPPAPAITLVFDPDKLREIEIDTKWDRLLASPESQRLLGEWAAEARRGK